MRRELSTRGIDEDAGDALLALLDRLVNADDRLAALRSTFEGHEDALEGVEALESLSAGLADAGVPAQNMQIDPALARGLGYYTGPIFEVAVADLAGSLAGGGRYDGLIGMFLGRDIPACGVSLGLERILVVMEERGMFQERASVCDVMMANFSLDTRGAVLQAATALRARGLNVDVYPRKEKLGKQFKHANSAGIPFVLVIGPDEAAQGRVKLKNMDSGEQRELSLEDVASVLLDAR